ncbi:MAG TPA: hypothetical protein VFD52_05820 [Clostridia bacterium]|nr:hypothetical protein [Clostridia bacterium]
MINETLARRSKENMSFSDYKPGSATAEFNAEIARVKALIEKAKANVSAEAQARLDNLLSSYTRNYANWINKSNSNGAGHVSVMIAGPSNYNMRAHEKYLNRERKLWEEYEQFKDIEWKIRSIVAGDKIIKSSDENAIEKLETKLAKLVAHQEEMKAINRILRNKKYTDEDKINALMKMGYNETIAKGQLEPDFAGRIGFTYQLQNNNGNMRNVRLRIEKLQRQKATAATEVIVEDVDNEDNNIRIVDNPQADRIQIFFPGKPDADIRTKLKSNGFRWAPSIGAWQSYRNDKGRRVAKEIAQGA